MENERENEHLGLHSDSLFKLNEIVTDTYNCLDQEHDRQPLHNSTPVKSTSPSKSNINSEKHGNISSSFAKTINAKLSPLKKRSVHFSPSKNTSINSHVTVELANYEPAFSAHAEPEKRCDDDQPLLKDDPESAKAPGIPVQYEDPSLLKVRRSKSFSEKTTSLLQRKKFSYSKLPFEGKLSRKEFQKKLRCLSVGNLSVDSTQNLNENCNFLTSHQQEPNSQSKSLFNISSQHSERHSGETALKNFPKIGQLKSKNLATVYQKTSQNLPLLNQNCSEQNRKMDEAELKRRSKSSQLNRFCKPTDKYSDDSNYVMLNPLSTVFFNNTEHQPTRRRERPKSTLIRQQPILEDPQIYPAKSFDCLRPEKVCSTPSSWNSQLGPPPFTPRLYTSPGIDYVAKIEDLLAKLRKSLGNTDDDDTSCFSNDSKSSFNNKQPCSEFPLKKSKSLEPILADSYKFAAATENSSTPKATTANRSKSRVRHIARKYNMYNSSENVSVSQTLEKDSQEKQSPFDDQDYVYLSQLPNTNLPSARPTPSVARNLNSELSALHYPPRNVFPISHPQDDVYMTSQRGDFYRLNLFVKNTRSKPDGAESTSNIFRSETDARLHRRLSNKEKPYNPQVFYALDV